MAPSKVVTENNEIVTVLIQCDDSSSSIDIMDSVDEHELSSNESYVLGYN